MMVVTNGLNYTLFAPVFFTHEYFLYFILHVLANDQQMSLKILIVCCVRRKCLWILCVKDILVRVGFRKNAINYHYIPFMHVSTLVRKKGFIYI